MVGLIADQSEFEGVLTVELYCILLFCLISLNGKKVLTYYCYCLLVLLFYYQITYFKCLAHSKGHAITKFYLSNISK